MTTPGRIVNVDHGGYARVGEFADSAVRSKQFTLDDNTRVRLTTDATTPPDHTYLMVRSESADGVVVYVGDGNVTVNDGFPLYPGDELELPVTADAAVHAIANPATGESATVYIVELL